MGGAKPLAGFQEGKRSRFLVKFFIIGRRDREWAWLQRACGPLANIRSADRQEGSWGLVGVAVEQSVAAAGWFLLHLLLLGGSGFQVLGGSGVSALARLWSKLAGNPGLDSGHATQPQPHLTWSHGVGAAEV